MVKFLLRKVNISLVKLFNLLIISKVLYGRVRDHLPLQQGLRPPIDTWRSAKLPVRDHLPLQQGLRQCTVQLLHRNRLVRDHLPLQQGLRLKNWSFKIPTVRTRPSSTTTRIKT